jgi:hypothetical protein
MELINYDGNESKTNEKNGKTNEKNGNENGHP